MLPRQDSELIVSAVTCLPMALGRESQCAVGQHGSWQLKLFLGRRPHGRFPTCRSAASGPENTLRPGGGGPGVGFPAGTPGQGQHTEFSGLPSNTNITSSYSHCQVLCFKMHPRRHGFIEGRWLAMGSNGK